MYVFMKESVVTSCFLWVQKPSFDDCKIVGLAQWKKIVRAPSCIDCSSTASDVQSSSEYSSAASFRFCANHALRLSSCSAHALVSQADCLLKVFVRRGTQSDLHLL